MLSLEVVVEVKEKRRSASACPMSYIFEQNPIIAPYR